MQKSMLMGKASNVITYQRWLEVLKGFTNVKTAKDMLVKHAEKLSTETKERFGKDFKPVLKSNNSDYKWNSTIHQGPIEKAPLMPNKRTKERSNISLFKETRFF